jgi:cell shape-determining protein MreC
MLYLVILLFIFLFIFYLKFLSEKNENITTTMNSSLNTVESLPNAIRHFFYLREKKFEARDKLFGFYYLLV